MIWIFTEGEGDEIEFRLPFKIFSSLKSKLNATQKVPIKYNKFKNLTLGTQISPNLKFCFKKKSPPQNFIRKTLVFFKKKESSVGPKMIFHNCMLLMFIISQLSRRSNKIIHISSSWHCFSKLYIPSSTIKTQKKSGKYFLRGRLSCQAILKISAILIKYLTLEGGGRIKRIKSMFIVLRICNFGCFSNSADFSSPSHFICKIQEQLVLSLRHECCQSAHLWSLKPVFLR